MGEALSMIGSAARPAEKMKRQISAQE